MKFEINNPDSVIKKIIKQQLDTTTSMNTLLDYCESINSDSIWNEFRKLNFETDTTKVKDWLKSVLSKEPPSDKINGFWFGLFNPVLDNNQVSCQLYISGSTTYNPNDFDWAVWDDVSYLPETRYADSQVLHRIYRLVEENNMLGDAEYILCLGYACFLVNSICQSISPELLYGGSKKRAIVVGFDSGDGLLIKE